MILASVPFGVLCFPFTVVLLWIAWSIQRPEKRRNVLLVAAIVLPMQVILAIIAYLL
jgi:heme A synthase